MVVIRFSKIINHSYNNDNNGASLVAQRVNHLTAMHEIPWVRSLGQQDPLEKEMAAPSSILAWRIPWTEEPGGLQRVRHDWDTNRHIILTTKLTQSGSSFELDATPGVFTCYFLSSSKRPERVKVLVAQLQLTICDLMDCSPPGSSVHGSLQPGTLEWVAMPFFRGSSGPRDQTWVSYMASRFFTI